jgi:hypothetical protein
LQEDSTKPWTFIRTAILPHSELSKAQHKPKCNVPSNFFYSCADLLLLWTENFYTTWRTAWQFKGFFVIYIIRIFTTKIENFHLRGHNSVCAEAFQLLPGRAPAPLRGNIAERATLFVLKYCFLDNPNPVIYILRSHKLFLQDPSYCCVANSSVFEYEISQQMSRLGFCLYLLSNHPSHTPIPSHRDVILPFSILKGPA